MTARHDRTRRCETLKALAAIAVFAAVGLVVALMPFRFGGALLSEHYLACLIGTVCLGFTAVVSGGRLALPWHFLPIGVLGALGIIQILGTHYGGDVIGTVSPSLTRTEVAKVFTACLFGVLGANLFRQANALRLLLWLIAVTGAFVAIAGLTQAPDTWEETWGASAGSKTQPFGPFINPNNAGAFLAIAVASSGALVFPLFARNDHDDLIGASWWHAGVAVLCGVLAYAGAMATGSRSAFAAATIAALVGLAAAFSGLSLRARVIAAISVSMTALIGFTQTERLAEATKHRIGSILAESRFEHWSTMLGSLGEKWLWGNGLGTYALVSRQFDVSPSGDVFEHADGQWVEIAVELGLVGCLAALAFLVWSLFIALRSHPATTRVATLAFLASMLFHSLFDYAIILPSVYVPVALVIGSLGARHGPTSPKWLSVVLLLCVGLGATVTLRSASEAQVVSRDLQKTLRTAAASAAAIEYHADEIATLSKKRPIDGELLFRLGQSEYALFVNEMSASDSALVARMFRAVEPSELTPLKLLEAYLQLDRSEDRESFRSHPAFEEHLQAAAKAFASVGQVEPLRAMPQVWACALTPITDSTNDAASRNGAVALAQAVPRHLPAQRALHTLGWLTDNRDLVAETARNLLSASESDDAFVVDRATRSFAVDEIARELIPRDYAILLRIAERLTTGPEDPLRQAIARQVASLSTDEIEASVVSATAAWLEGTTTVESLQALVDARPEDPHARRLIARQLAESGRNKDALVELRVVESISELTSSDRAIIAKCQKALRESSGST